MVCPVAAAADEHISWRARGDIGGGVHQGSELGAAAASTKAIWWDLHLASLLTHLFFVCFSVCLCGYGFLSGGKR